MKQSQGLSQLLPTVTFLTLFICGATVQALGMRHTDLGPSYIFVLGVEAIMTVLLSAFYLHEHYSASRLTAIFLVVSGVAWLRHS
jgi:multidrug transporter EmrE-like cation transporter